VVVHVMQPAIRSYYNLEELWGGKGPARVRAANAAA
jgi:ribosome-associated protein